MPTSNLAVAPAVLWTVAEVDHGRILDVGPGWGKYAVLLREYLNDKPTRIDAVEAWVPYVDQHGLGCLYDRIWPTDVCLLPDDVLASYDVVLMVDVIEHIDKAAAIELLARIPCRVVICTPVEWFATDDGLPPTEAHVSHWTVADFEATGRLEAYSEVVGGHVARLSPQRS